MRHRLAAVAALTLIAGAGLTQPVSAADMDECIRGRASVTTDGEALRPVLAATTLAVPIGVAGSGDWFECDGMTATVEKADGSLRTTIALTQRGGHDRPPVWTRYGYLLATVATGAGDWVITGFTHGEFARETWVPFRVLRGSVVTIDQPATTRGTARTTVTGLLRHYTSTGALVPVPNTVVRVTHTDRRSLIATARTNAAGRYSVRIPFTQTTTMKATAAAAVAWTSTESRLVTAHKLLQVSPLTQSRTAFVNTWWTVSGAAFPGRVGTALEYWTGSAWSIASSGPVAANGSYQLAWKPTRAGTFRLRVTVAAGLLDNSPLRRELVVKVTQLPRQPTFLDGVVRPTAGTPARPGSAMSTFGHLRIRKADGTLGPLANQWVTILAKGANGTGWFEVASARTTSTGYFYSNWNIFYDLPPGNYSVQLRYTTTLPRAASTFSIIGTVAVQP